MEYISIAEAAKRWGIDSSRVGRLAREGRIEGAIIVARNWLIPENAEKPSDGRMKKPKSMQNEDLFRFPLFVNAPADSFSPPLTKEELLLRTAQLDYYACNFDDAQNAFDRLSKISESNYTRIISLFYLCSLAVEAYGGENFMNYSAKLQLELSKDFPHKKDMAVVTPWLYTIMVQLQAVSDSLNVDPLYDYSPDVQPLISYLSFYHLAKDYSSGNSGLRIDIYEMLCRQLLQTGHYYEACELHFLLFLAYYVSIKKEQMLFHLKKALALVKEHNFYIIAASYEFYYQDAFDSAFRDFPEDFAECIKDNSDIISKSISKFSEKYDITNIYSTMKKDDYRYLVLAYQGYSNKAVAKNLHISERTVAAHYAVLYEKLGVKGKQELIDLCSDSLFT